MEEKCGPDSSYPKSKASSGGTAIDGENDRFLLRLERLDVRRGPGPGLETQEVGSIKYVREKGYGSDALGICK